MTGHLRLSILYICLYEQMVLRGSFVAIWQNAALPFKPLMLKSELPISQ